MRNWNWRYARNRDTTERGFQTTYEELKLESIQKTRMKPICFQTTYEELKPFRFRFRFRAPRLPMRNWNQNNQEYEDRLIGAPRLPMRNWNTDQIFQYTHISYCSQTTYEELKHLNYYYIKKDYQAPRLPMRNWNMNFWTHFQQQKSAPRLPMRNWNLRISFNASTDVVAPRLPMRNWNMQ